MSRFLTPPRLRLGFTHWMAACLLFGCGGSKTTEVPGTSGFSAVAGTGGSAAARAAEDLTADLEAGFAYAVFRVENRGAFVVRFEQAAAPKTSAQIKNLVTQGFYDGLEFHRVEEYLVQTGRPNGDAPPTVEGEMFGQNLKHEPGAVGLARLVTDYDSGSSQFYVMKERKVNWNQEYTLFGTVVRGMETVSAIRRGDKIESAVVVEK